MNRIYKVIWSKVKHQYVVVSELAHSCTKGAAISAGRHTAAVLTVLALTAGVGSQALADNSTAIGSNSVIDVTSEGGATLGNNTAIGSNSDGAIAIGGDPDTNDEETTAATVGNNATNAIAMGTNATVNDNGQNSIAIGNGATISKNSTASIAMGLNAQVDTGTGVNNAIAIGSSAHAGGVGGIAIGKEAGTIGAKTGAVAIGINAQAASNSIVMGQNAIADSGQAVAIGYNAESHSSYGAAIGRDAYVGSNSYGIALGGFATVGKTAMKSIAIGASGGGDDEGKTEVKEGASYSIAMGGKTTVGEDATESVAIGGYSASVGDDAIRGTAVGTWAHVAAYVEEGAALGYNAGANANYGTALGSWSKANGEKSTSAGYNSSANGEWSTALGASTDANHQATAVGSNAQALAGNSVAVGVNSSVAEGADYSVALGTSSKVEEGDAFTTTDLEDFKKKLGDTYNAAWNITSADGTLGVVSVGAKGEERRLVNVARGRIDADSTDAVNGSQLYGLASDLNQKIEKAGGDWTLTTNGGPNDAEKTTVGKGDVVDFSGAKDENRHQNIQISQEQTKDDDGNVTGTKVAVDLNDRIELGAGDQQIVMDATDDKGILTIGNNISMSANGAANFGNIQFNSEGQADPQHVSTITGLSNTEWDPNTTYNSGRAATEEQLQKAVNQVNADAYNGWKVSANGENDVLVERGDVVDFSSATKTVTRGQETEEHKNITISQDNTDLTFTLNDDLYLGNVNEGTGAYVNVLGSTGQILLGKDATNFINIDGGSRTISGLSNLTWDPMNQKQYDGSSLAATESQLHDAFGYLNDKIDNIDVNISGDDNVNVGKNEGAGSGTGTGESTGSGSADAPKFDFDISMSDTPQFGGHTDDDKGHAANGSVTIVGTGADGTSHKVVIDGATGLASGLSNTDWDWNKYEEGGYQTSNAATESQLHGAMEGTVQYDRDENGNVDKTNVTLNKGGDSVTIHNVAAGTADTDAVNVSQLNQAWDQINNNTTAITNIGNKVGELDSRIDEVGAGAAALAALHPLDFDPDDKWDFAAGYGNYRGENAVAIGAFYRPNEDTMFSVGGTVGNGDNMVNAGVSFKLGQGNNVSTSRVAMAKEIKSMRDIVAKQDAQIQKLTAMVNALVGMEAIAPDTTTMFPDVPENHWAYEAVASMAKTGLVKGYPDGEFKGDRNMTRYEFAQIVYNAIQAGIKVDERLVQEFRPELEYFRIDTISKDKDGNPVIQRVRANEIPATK
ncbi:S-layer homology domain-containing protein [Megasphaera elsdenii]|uniref:ESPR-type extended signal peptide-containing protein n=1 Tax=Megasphaera elsdenii TaxID=907 RepID=UPI001959FFB4|nr:ESPR-type extended signal peptide-containing protein [Megasphaera elsdenii]MBM6702854.1 S-layer homology domain-containing protein [Megasphaera elsdenii]